MFPLILTFNFDLFLGHIWLLQASRGQFLGGVRLKILLGSIHIAEQLLFSMLPSIMNLNFDIFLGYFLLFEAQRGHCWGSSNAQKCFCGLLFI